MTLPNFENRVSQNLTLAKPLENLISNYYILHPSIRFVADKAEHWKYDGRTGRDVGDPMPIGGVSVYQDSQYLGCVRVVWEEYRGAGRMDVYHVKSDNINKRRGPFRNTAKTKDAHKAIKIMEEAFKPKNVNEYRERVVSEAKMQIDHLLSSARYKVTKYTERINTSSDIAMYLLATYEGTQPKLEGSLAEMFSTDEKLQDFHNLRIALSVSNDSKKGGIVVVEYSDGAMVYTTGEGIYGDGSLEKLNSTYDLPKNYQEKLALIKLCDSSQPVENIGVWFSVELEKDRNTSLYYLTEGDTVTSC